MASQFSCNLHPQNSGRMKMPHPNGGSDTAANKIVYSAIIAQKRGFVNGY